MRRGAKPAKARVAKLPVARKSRKSEGSRVDDLERRLAEALEQQTATSEILRVISSSPTDIQPVLDAVAASAARLCESLDAEIFRRDGDRLLLVAHYGPIPTGSLGRSQPLVPGTFNGRAVLDGRTLHVADLQSETDEFPQGSEFARQHGSRAQLSVPLLREGIAIGTISLRRIEARLFTERQIALLQTFANQAVIAIENVRLFKELEARNRDLTEALDQQTGTSEILRVIASSPTDLQPVLDAVAERAARLCSADDAIIYSVDGDVRRQVAHFGSIPRPLSAEVRLSQGTATGRAILDRRTIHIPDVFEELARGEYPETRQRERGLTSRTLLITPLLREDVALGAITIRRTEMRPFSERQIALVETFADQAVIAIENVRLFKELEVRNRDLTEALEQQTATSEILRVISRSQTDVQPVFDTIVKSAARLCDGVFGTLVSFDGELLRLVATHNFTPTALDVAHRIWPAPPSRATTMGRAILERSVIHVPDIELDREYGHPELPRAAGWRSVLAVPMLRDGAPLGAIAVGRAEPGPFSDNQTALLKTFADQAVIAIENVRLFKELQEKNSALTQAHAQVTESLEQQTATSEILRVISSSPTYLQPVLDAVAERAARLCSADDVKIHLVDGEVLRLTAQVGPIATIETRPVTRTRHIGRVILERRTIHVHDMKEALEEFPDAADQVLPYGVRTALATPLLREGAAIGVIQIRRLEVKPFSEKQIAILETFADQAVIAIENVRLFTELEEKNRALTQAHAQVTETLEQQTATSEILRVISRSPTDVQPVFDAIARSATRLCEGTRTLMCTFDGELISLAAYHNATPEALESARTELFPLRPRHELPFARAILNRAVVHVPDVDLEPGPTPEFLRQARVRSALCAPLLRDGHAIGVIAVSRTEARPFSDAQIELLRTFADQAVIAIENVRLFTELQASNRDLTETLEQQTATAEILRVISSSPTDLQPVFDTIVRSASQLCAGQQVVLISVRGNVLDFLAGHHDRPEGQAAIRAALPAAVTRATTAGRAVLERRVIQIPDIVEDGEYGLKHLGQVVNYRATIGVPLMRDDDPIGVLVVGRELVGYFSERQVDLLKTFADQAVIAIENVRLFKELEVRNKVLTESLEQQTATSDVLRVISQSQTDIQPVFDALIESATKLCVADIGAISRLEGDILRLVLHSGMSAEVRAFWEQNPPALARGSVTGRAALERRTIHVPDILADSSYDYSAAGPLRKGQALTGYRAALVTPMLRDGAVIGTIAMMRREARPFTASQIKLLETFADQAVIAIENVRLFTELEEKNRALTQAHAQVSESLEQQTATSEILRVISQSPTDVQPVFDAIVKSAVSLCDGLFSSLFQFDGKQLHAVAQHNFTPEALLEMNRLYPAPPSRAHGSARAILERAVVHIPDVEIEPEYQHLGLTRAVGMRSGLFVPMLREGNPVGVIIVARATPGYFAETQIALLKTFGDQAVIAIENVRLFTELQARTQELTRSVGQLTALGEVGRAVSSTLDLETVLSTIVSRAIQLSGTDGGSVYEYDEATEEFSLRASRDLPEAYIEQVRDVRPRKGEGAVGRVAQTREPVQIVDIADAAAYESRVRNILLQIGLRALLAVPLLAEDRLVGALIVMRKRTGTFAAEEVALLQTFATQSALAIQNARLFLDIEDKSRQIEVASQHKSEFLANMSHELRTPLNAIIGFSEVLSERMFGDLNEKQEEYLKDIYASGTHLLSLINDILDLSKIEAGRMELELTDFHLPTALDSALTLVRERAGRRGIALQMNVDNRLGQIQADERKIRQVVLNLLSNAIKFTPEGGRIEVGAVPRDGSVEVSVSDTGVGIAPEDQEAVFEEFRQVGVSTAKQEGTGLGLTLCRKFVELHGGRIWVKSEVGHGSTFTFTIPVRHGE